MKKIFWMNCDFCICLLLLYCLMTGVAYGQEGTWTRKANVGNNGRQGAVAFSIGNKGYLGTGVSYQLVNNTTTFVFNNDFWEFDPVNNVWTQKANFPGGPRWKATGFSIGNKGYLGTGLTDNDYNNSHNDFWQFDPVANVWTRKANFGGGLRQAAVGFSIYNKGYIGTGGDQANLVSDFWEYDPVIDVWTKKANYAGNQPRGSAVGFSIGSKGYVGTGSGNNVTADFWEYNPATDVWIQKANLPAEERQGAIGFGMGTKGYIGTGLGQSSSLFNDFWEYDPVSNTWAQKANFTGSARCFAVGLTIGNKGYIGTGAPSGPLANDLWQYEVTTTNDTTAAVTVPGTSNPWLAGMPNGTKAALGDIAPANSPVLVNVKLTAGSWIEVSNITGTAAHGPYPPYTGPEGCLIIPPCYFTNITHEVGAEYGKSSLTAPINSLIGVFLNDNIPTDPTPNALDFSSQSARDYLELRPQLKQVFFIGDGKTSSGILQKIFIPNGATRLFLGMMDGIQWTGNSGAFNLTVSVVNKPPVTSCGIHKVQVCHKGKSLCIASSAIRAHLNHGDQLGSCTISSAKKSKGSKGNSSVVEGEAIHSFNASIAPNPFHSSTRMQYEIPVEGHVKISVFDALGRLMTLLVDSKHKAGIYNKDFSTATLSKGLYYYQVRYVTDQNQVLIKSGKMIITR